MSIKEIYMLKINVDVITILVENCPRPIPLHDTYNIYGIYKTIMVSEIHTIYLTFLVHCRLF